MAWRVLGATCVLPMCGAVANAKIRRAAGAGLGCADDALDLGGFRETLDGPFTGVDVIRGGRFDLEEAIDPEPRTVLALELAR